MTAILAAAITMLGLAEDQKLFVAGKANDLPAPALVAGMPSEDFEEAIRNADESLLDRLVKEGSVVLLKPGTPLRVLEKGKGTIRARVLKGTHEGKKVDIRPILVSIDDQTDPTIPEREAEAILKKGEKYAKAGEGEVARGYYKRVVDEYPKTKAADVAKARLKAAK